MHVTAIRVCCFVLSTNPISRSWKNRMFFELCRDDSQKMADAPGHGYFSLLQLLYVYVIPQCSKAFVHEFLMVKVGLVLCFLTFAEFHSEAKFRDSQQRITSYVISKLNFLFVWYMPKMFVVFDVRKPPPQLLELEIKFPALCLDKIAIYTRTPIDAI